MTKEYIIPSVKSLIDLTENGNSKFNVVSLFAGGGGSSTGYRMAGGKVLAVNEFIDEAVNTYKSNWPSTKIINKDIRFLDANEILDLINLKKFDLDILDGSPPCSAFSIAGKVSKSWGKNKKYSDKSQSNVEDLFFKYIRILSGVMPKVFVAENVSGLYKGKSKGYFNQIIIALRECGYNVSCKILNARNLGVPQSRTRLIFIGVRNDLWDNKFTGNLHPKPLNYTFSLTEAFKGLVFSNQDRIDTDMTSYAVYKLLKNLKPGEQNKKRFSLFKCRKDTYCQCITATTGRISAAKSCHWNNRALTVSEVKRIMSIPDDYILTGTYQQKVERLGRMVAPFMMRSVAESILKTGVLNDK